MLRSKVPFRTFIVTRNGFHFGMGMPASLMPLQFKTNMFSNGIKIPEAHGGTFDFDSIPGQGTTAAVTLPMSRVISDFLEATA